MRYIYRCLAAVLVLALFCASTALAVVALELEGVDCPPDSGLLYAVVSTDYTEDEDLNFTAKTENGNLEVASAVSMRKEGTTWFVVLDFDRDCGWTTEGVVNTEKRVLEKLAQIIPDYDKGALVLAAKDPQINIQDAYGFRSALEGDPGYSDTEQLGNTLKYVMDYIDGNRENFLPKNVAVVVVTSGLVNAEMIDGSGINCFKTILSQHPNVTTHIICTVAPIVTVPMTDETSWRSRAGRMAGYANQTLGGTGTVTDALTNDEADRAVAVVLNAERRLIRLALNPCTVDNIGKTLTITQTTSGVTVLEGSWDITKDNATAYNNWLEYWQKSPEDVTPVEAYIPFSNSSTFVLIDSGVDNAIKPVPTPFPTALVVGIAIGVLILVLLIVLIAVSRKGKSNDSSSASTYVPVSPQPTETVVVFQDEAGNKLTGRMKNGKLTVGRYAGKGSMLVISDDPKLSGLHATLTKRGQGLTIMDNHSTNGTKVNGTLISDAVPLTQNDSVAMGSHTYRVTWRA